MQNQLIEAIKTVLSSLGVGEVVFVVEHPGDLSHGDYATNVALIAAKQVKKNPKVLAEEIVSKLKELNLKEVKEISIAGPGFINFTLVPEFFAKEVEKVLEEKSGYGRGLVYSGKRFVVEYSSPNIAKPFTIGHLRSTIIGDSIANLVSFTGGEVIRDNHLGDWGTQFGKQIVAIEKWGGLEALEMSENKMKYLVDLYVRFHSEAEKDPTLEDKARARFVDLEKGEEGAKKIYEATITCSKEYFSGIYSRLGVSSFDTELGESFYGPRMGAILEELMEKNLARESEGALAVFFENDMYPPMLVRKTDGSTLYATRDLATDRYRLDTYGKDTTIVNEVGTEQTLYFRQLFETEHMLGWVKEGQRIHVGHGLYRFAEGKMSTRKGNVIWLEDILDEAVKRASEINEQGADLVAIGAIKFNDLKRESSQDIVFSWDEVMNLKGDSGPYVQYAAVRASAVLKKGEELTLEPSATRPAEETLSNVERLIPRFPEVAKRAAEELAPHHVAGYLIELAGAFNNYYAHTSIAEKSNEASSYRLALAKAVSIVLVNGLLLLGIKTPERM